MHDTKTKTQRKTRHLRAAPDPARVPRPVEEELFHISQITAILVDACERDADINVDLIKIALIAVHSALINVTWPKP